MVIMTIRGWLAACFMLFVPASLLFSGCEDEQSVAVYGPAPACSNDAQCEEMVGEGWVCGEDGWCLQDGDEDWEDDAREVYGPQPCYSDERCANIYGEGWVCDTNSGECVAPGDVDEDATDEDWDYDAQEIYGPQPCNSDEECAYLYGEGWVCDTNSGECVAPGDADEDPADEDWEDDAREDYGPLPCQIDEDCSNLYGEGWVCDTTSGRCFPAGDQDWDQDCSGG